MTHCSAHIFEDQCSFITDRSGEAVQHLLYLPFGESFVTQTSTSWESRFTFSGKEKDVETGYSYFGARYYDSDLSVWLSVDPLADKYPSMSAYMYTAGNPVMLVDPDGRDWFQNELTGDVYYNSSMTKGQEGTGAMTGEGWVHMGENGMFMKDENDIMNSDQIVLFRNGAGLADSEDGDASFTVNADGTAIIEGSFKGDNAKQFMSNCGYSFVPKEYDFYNNVMEHHLSEGDGPIIMPVDNGSYITNVYSYQYVRKDLYRHTKVLDYGTETRNPVAGTTSLIYHITSTNRQTDYYNNFPSMGGTAKDFALMMFDSHAESFGEFIYNSVKKLKK